MTQPNELISQALSTETFFTTLNAEVRLELLAVLVVDRILEDVENGQVLLQTIEDTP